MYRPSVAGLAVATALSVVAGRARADEIVLDYPSTLARAAERAPAVIATRARIAEAEARAVDASVIAPHNPQLTIAAGPRRRAGASTADLELELSQTVELGGRRGARIQAARAEVAQAEATAEADRRAAARLAAIAFTRAVVAERQEALARAAATAADEIDAVTGQRLARGVALPLELSLARAARGRAHAALAAARGDHAAALGELRAILGLAPDDRLVLRGELPVAPPPPLATLLAAVPRRPELASLAAAARAGRATVALGRGLAWPDVTVGVRWGREEDAQLVMGAVTFTLPVLARGQGERATGAAQIRRAGVEADAVARAFEAEVRAAFEVHAARRAAVDALERDVLPQLDESDRLLARAYEAGQVTIADYLAARRELQDARRDHLERLAELALARIELDAAAGVLP